MKIRYNSTVKGNVPQDIFNKLVDFVPKDKSAALKFIADMNYTGYVSKVGVGYCSQCGKIHADFSKIGNSYFDYTCNKCGTLDSRASYRDGALVMYEGAYKDEQTYMIEMSASGAKLVKAIYDNTDYDFSITVTNVTENYKDIAQLSRGYHGNFEKTATEIRADFLADHPYVDAQFEWYDREHTIKTATAYLLWPFLEKLQKAGFNTLASEAVGFYSPELFFRNFKNESSLEACFQIPKWMYDADRAELDIQGLNQLRITHKKYPMSYDIFKKFNIVMTPAYPGERRSVNIAQFKKILALKQYTLEELIKYLDRADKYQGMYPSETMQVLLNYCEMCKSMGIEPEKAPASLKREHDVMVRNHVYSCSEADKQAFLKAVKELEPYEYSGKKFMAICPKTPNDLMEEAKEMRNCLKSYVTQVAYSQSRLFFVRRKNAPNKSYVAVELTNDFTDIIEASGKYSAPVVDKETLEFLQEWLNNNILINSGLQLLQSTI